jgi:hypothetical protein
VVLLVLCPCLGLGAWAVVKYQQDNPKPAPTSTATASPSPSDTESAEPTPTQSSSGSDAAIAKGDCVVNKGTDADPDLKKVPCGPGTYEVLSRIPFTTDEKKCNTDPIFGAKGTNATYVSDSSQDFADFVLCMKKR